MQRRREVAAVAVAEPAVAGVEVVAKARRRRFSAAYKQTILAEAAGCTESGAIGALLRREGLYSSHLAVWREAVRQNGGAPQKRGPVPQPRDPRDRTITDLERQLARALTRAARAEALVAIQGKVSELLGIVLPPSREDR